MHRFFVDPKMIQGSQVTLSEEDSAHAVRVLRLHAGDELLICDGNQHEYNAVVLEAQRNGMLVQLNECHDMNSEPETQITLFQGYPKADKFELILQKGTEVGVSAFVPFYSEYCDVKPTRREKNDRYKRIIYEAAKQSGRGALPEIHDARTWQELLDGLKGYDAILVAYEAEEQVDLREIFATGIRPNKIALIVGPEGGFAKREIEELRAQGAVIVTLGKRILRTETAGIVFPALVLYERGDLS